MVTFRAYMTIMKYLSAYSWISAKKKALKLLSLWSSRNWMMDRAKMPEKRRRKGSLKRSKLRIT